MSEINYVEGDATEPYDRHPGKPIIIAHVCNDVGGWGRGFVMALSAKDKRPEKAYRTHVTGDSSSLKLGDTIMTLFDPTGEEGEDVNDVFVANMIAQRGFATVTNNVPLDYKALRTCLDEVGQEAAKMEASVHMPRIGCGLAGGDWAKVEEIILETLVDIYKLDVYVYDLPKAS